MQNTFPQATRDWPAEAMTDAQFVAYADDYLFGEGSEVLYEQIAEAQSEIAMFGDSGPGTGIHIRESIAEWNKIANRLQAITGRVIQHRPRPPVHNYEPSYDDYR